jgi:hypothetical protein
MKKVLLFILCTSLLLSACGKGQDPRIIIIPKQCELTPGQTLPLSLETYNKPSDGMITWSATAGTFSSTNELAVVYTAPTDPGTVIITAVLEADEEQFSTTLTCTVKGIQITIDITSTPTRDTPITEEPSLTSTPSRPVGDTIAITEVMAYPCNFTDSLPSINEYIELYNYGGADVNVGDWWVGTTGGGKGTPDQLKSWSSVNPTIDLGSNYTVNSTIIPPGGFAVVVSPNYWTGSGNNRMPYHFPSGTVVLTFSTSQYVGNDSLGLSASTHPLTTIVLYKGTNSIISTVISTYGTPFYGSDPNNIKDDHQDNLPFPITEQCHVMERIDAARPDSLDNWHELTVGNPGRGDY